VSRLDSREVDRTPAPGIALPEGSSALRGIGENSPGGLATDAGSLTIPIPSSPGRSASGPKLNLSYDAGSAHGPSGMVWSRLRIEGLYARTEPWTAVDPGDPLRPA